MTDLARAPEELDRVEQMQLGRALHGLRREMAANGLHLGATLEVWYRVLSETRPPPAPPAVAPRIIAPAPTVGPFPREYDIDETRRVLGDVSDVWARRFARSLELDQLAYRTSGRGRPWRLDADSVDAAAERPL